MNHLFKFKINLDFLVHELEKTANAAANVFSKFRAAGNRTRIHRKC